jgi:hypothetical protein
VSLPASRATEPRQQAILAHYERVAPLIVANFPHAPLVVSYYPDGLGTQPTYSGGTWTKPLPESIPRTTVTTRSGIHTYPTCAVNTILWLIHHNGVGIHSWTPSKDNPESVGVARILFTPVGHADQPLLKEALLAMRSVLHDRGALHPTRRRAGIRTGPRMAARRGRHRDRPPSNAARARVPPARAAQRPPHRMHRCIERGRPPQPLTVRALGRPKSPDGDAIRLERAEHAPQRPDHLGERGRAPRRKRRPLRNPRSHPRQSTLRRSKIAASETTQRRRASKSRAAASRH